MPRTELLPLIINFVIGIIPRILTGLTNLPVPAVTRSTVLTAGRRATDGGSRRMSIFTMSSVIVLPSDATCGLGNDTDAESGRNGCSNSCRAGDVTAHLSLIVVIVIVIDLPMQSVVRRAKIPGRADAPTVTGRATDGTIAALASLSQRRAGWFGSAISVPAVTGRATDAGIVALASLSRRSAHVARRRITPGIICDDDGDPGVR